MHQDISTGDAGDLLDDDATKPAFRITPYDPALRKALEESIRHYGRNLKPIFKQQSTGRTIDGSVREQICKKRGIEPWIETIDCTDEDFDFLRLELNQLSSNGTQSQKAMRTVRILHERVSKKAEDRRHHRGLVSEVTQAQETGRTRVILARHAGVSTGLIRQAVDVWTHDRELASRVECGSLAVGAAWKEIRQPRIATERSERPVPVRIEQAVTAAFESVKTENAENGFEKIAEHERADDDQNDEHTAAPEGAHETPPNTNVDDCMSLALPADPHRKAETIVEMMQLAAEGSRKVYLCLPNRLDKDLLRLVAASTDMLFLDEPAEPTIVLGVNVSTTRLVQAGLKGVVMEPILASVTASKMRKVKTPASKPAVVPPSERTGGGNLIVLSDEQIRALGVLKRAQNVNTANPILFNVLIRRENGVVDMSTTDLHVWATHRSKSEGNDLATTIPMQPLLDALKGSNAAMLDVKGESVTVMTDHASREIQSMAWEYFPGAPDLGEAVGCVSGPVGYIVPRIERASTYASRDEGRGAVLMSTLLEANVEGARISASDAFQLTVDEIRGIETHGTISAMLPPAVVAVLKAMGKAIPANSTCRIAASENHARFETEAWTIQVRVTDGKYPDIEKVVQSARSTTSVTLDREALLTAVQQARTVSPDRSSQIAITLEQEDLVITARDLYEHLFETSVPALERDGATQTTLLNGRTLESILGTFDGEHIRIETAEAYAPCRIFDPAQPRTLALLMPLRDNQAPSAIAADAAA